MSMRNLGLILDNTLGMEKQVNYICKSCYYQIRNIRLIRKYINDETWKILVQALIISRLVYGNALLYNILLSLTNRLQRVQNCAARLVTRTCKGEHITQVLFQLHWLPVRFRSLCKVLNGTAPVYVSDLIEIIYQWECSDLNPIHFWGYQEAIQQCTETYLVSFLKTYLFKLAYL